jgi:hypothetical protein
MTKPNPNPVFRSRKGIYTHLDSTQSLIGDERWQFVAAGDGFLEFANECTRPAPFSEPRRDALTWTLRQDADGGWEPDTLAIHASSGRREAQVSWSGREDVELAFFCWQHGSVVKRMERAWPPSTALGFRSGCVMTALLRGLPPSAVVSINIMWMNTLSFAPETAGLRVARLGRAQRQTHFGPRALEGFDLACDIAGDAEAHALLNGQVWRDDSGIVHEWLGADGGVVRLTAAN